LALAACAQAAPVRYSYAVALDTSKPLGGKQVLDIVALDMSDKGDIAVLAKYAGGIGVWSGKKQEWVASTGQPITSAEGHPVTLTALANLSVSPVGNIRYTGAYQAINPKTRMGEFRTGYFIDGKITYELNSQDQTLPGLFMPDGTILYVTTARGNTAATSGSRLVLSTVTGAPPTSLFPPTLWMQTVNYLAVDKATGHYAFMGYYIDAANKQHTDLFCGLTPQKYFRTAGGFTPTPFINGKDDIAYSAENRLDTFINGQPSPYKGIVRGFNDARELLVEGNRRVTVNDTVVIAQGNYTSLTLPNRRDVVVIP
jgi:hypothetical protein